MFVDHRLKRDPLPPPQPTTLRDASPHAAASRAREAPNVGRDGWIRRLLAVFVFGTLACVAVACIVCRVFYADGAYVVLGLLLTPMRYNDYDFHRSFASFIGQTPVFLGERLGIENVSAYGGLYGFAVGGLPLILYIVGLAIARKSPGLFAATVFALAVFGFGANFINTEANLFLGLAWLTAVVMALPGQRPFARGIALPALAFVLLRVYEGMLLAGPVLAAWSYAKARRTGDVNEKIGLVLASLLFALGTLVGFSGFVAPRDPGNAASFASAIFVYLRNPQMWLLLSAVAALGAVAFARPTHALAAVVLSVALAVPFVATMAREQGYYAYGIYYYNRSFLVLLLPVVLAALAIAESYRPRWLSEGFASRRLLPLVVPFVAVVSVDLLGSVRWFAYMNTFCDVLARPTTAAAGIGELKASGAVTGWAWTHPILSILLRKQGSSAVVLDDPGNWKAIDLASPIVLPYRGACENRRFGGHVLREARSP